ncbi:uncharacterized protein [Ptychodera flava]|uniref:uncharacterized protein n=1 Tax=Ptychodera flava TaxID=63121 RepID=UPI00396A3C7D
MMFKDLGNESKQKQYIIDTLRQFSSITCLKNRRKVTVIDLRVLGKKTCEQAWREIYNVSEKRYEDCIKLLRDGKVNVEHGNVHKKRSSAKAERALSWMRLLFERIGDWMPHKTQVHLPTSSSKKLFYIRMLKELEDDLGIKKEDNISYEYFTEIWRQHLPEFVIPKKQEFVKCNICVQLREDLARAKTAMERGKIKDLIDKHVQQVEIERRVYHNTREQARTESDEVMCVIQDGMDQAKTVFLILLSLIN